MRNLICLNCRQGFNRHHKRFPHRGKAISCAGFQHPSPYKNVIPFYTICVRCGIEYGDHQAKEPHANTYGNPRCAGFSLEKKKNYILSDYEREMLDNDPQAVRSAIIELLGEDPLTEGT